MPQVFVVEYGVGQMPSGLDCSLIAPSDRERPLVTLAHDGAVIDYFAARSDGARKWLPGWRQLVDPVAIVGTDGKLWTADSEYPMALMRAVDSLKDRAAYRQPVGFGLVASRLDVPDAAVPWTGYQDLRAQQTQAWRKARAAAMRDALRQGWDGSGSIIDDARAELNRRVNGRLRWQAR